MFGPVLGSLMMLDPLRPVETEHLQAEGPNHPPGQCPRSLEQSTGRFRSCAQTRLVSDCAAPVAAGVSWSFHTDVLLQS